MRTSAKAQLGPRTSANPHAALEHIPLHTATLFGQCLSATAMESSKRKAQPPKKSLAILYVLTDNGVEPEDAVAVYKFDIEDEKLLKECNALNDALANYSKSEHKFDVGENDMMWMPSKPFNAAFPLIGATVDDIWKNGGGEKLEGGITRLVTDGGADYCFNFTPVW